jgi:hypothetical protein
MRCDEGNANRQHRFASELGQAFLKGRVGATGFKFASDSEGGLGQRASLAANLVAEIHDSDSSVGRAAERSRVKENIHVGTLAE